MSQDVIGSRMSSFPDLQDDKRGLGQNGFSGASSDLPDECTQSDFAKDITRDPEGVLARIRNEGHHDNSGTDDAVKDLERKIDTTAYPTSHGLSDPNANNTRSLGTDSRPVTKR